jgi:hypothetical protein
LVKAILRLGRAGGQTTLHASERGQNATDRMVRKHFGLSA